MDYYGESETGYGKVAHALGLVTGVAGAGAGVGELTTVPARADEALGNFILRDVLQEAKTAPRASRWYTRDIGDFFRRPPEPPPGAPAILEPSPVPPVNPANLI